MTINDNVIYNPGYVEAQKSLEKIATGLQLNQAADDASSLAISEKLDVEASGISQSIENVNSGLALTQIGDKAIDEQSKLLDNIKEKLLEAANGTTSDEGREALFDEIQKSLEQLDNIAEQTNYNGQTILQADRDDQSASNPVQFQAGTSSDDIVESGGIQANTEGLNLQALRDLDVSNFTADTARDFLDDVDNAVDTLNTYRGELGSTSNQLESSSRNLATQYTNTREASAILSNVDYASEVTNFSKQNILAQVGAFTQAQSNVTQSAVLRLLH
jgi:flagellin